VGGEAADTVGVRDVLGDADRGANMRAAAVPAVGESA
jgi:hypothetical protein